VGWVVVPVGTYLIYRPCSFFLVVVVVVLLAQLCCLPGLAPHMHYYQPSYTKYIDNVVATGILLCYGWPAYAVTAIDVPAHTNILLSIYLYVPR
jgi:hypothetical protein